MITPDMCEWLSSWALKDELSNGMTDPAQIFNKYIKKIINCVEFTSNELKCVPIHLVYEMFKTMKANDNAKFYAAFVSTNRIIANAVPFLYYLKYLSSTNNSRKKEAIEKIVQYMETLSKHLDSNDHRHFDTTLNMFGHIFECENSVQEAFSYYYTSVKNGTTEQFSLLAFIPPDRKMFVRKHFMKENNTFSSYQVNATYNTRRCFTKYV
ncbi:hypothetical protein DPMN_099563 [Dreissena polymorpha]|uniref:Uncharacterized protein n=1 Tax=Dreissena polymorpha TaxID=45954 RepID=A0A9D4R6J7_DREPO|nr:hypothetical protein DPMN_099563 [Dreissena polymorpha]